MLIIQYLGLPCFPAVPPDDCTQNRKCSLTKSTISLFSKMVLKNILPVISDYWTVMKYHLAPGQDNPSLYVVHGSLPLFTKDVSNRLMRNCMMKSVQIFYFTSTVATASRYRYTLVQVYYVLCPLEPFAWALHHWY